MTNNSTISYTGTIVTKILSGKQVISTKTFHNSGNLPLFKFLCYCLAGNYNEVVAGLIPGKIKLFHNIADNPRSVDSDVIPRSTLITVNTTASIEQDLANNSCTTTLHFLVPFALLIDTDDTETASINEIAIYPMETTESEAVITGEDTQTYSAKFKLTKTVGPHGIPLKSKILKKTII